MKQKNKGRRVVLRAVLSVVISIAASLSGTTSPASAHTGATGVQFHVGVPYQPSPPCARYLFYRAEVVFPSGVNAVNAIVSSDSGTVWGENPNGSYANSSDCGLSGGGLAAISGFTARLDSGTASCTRQVTYQRVGVDIKIKPGTVISASPTGACATLTPSPFEYHLLVVGGTATACNSPIAPTTCAIGEAAP